jgi:hypothetical protein
MEEIEWVFYWQMREVAQETILSGWSVEQTRAAVEERWPRLDNAGVERIMWEALIDDVLSPDLDLPWPGAELSDLHPSWSAEPGDEDDPSFAQPNVPNRLTFRHELPREKPEAEEDEPPDLPIAHLGTAGVTTARCGAEILGIHAWGEFRLCPVCAEIKRRELQGPS